MSYVIDLSPMVPVVFGILLYVLKQELIIWVPRAINAVETRTGLHLNDSDRAAIQDAAQNAAGLLVGQVYQGAITHEDLHLGNQHVADAINHVLTALPATLARQGVTAETIGNMVLGKTKLALSADTSIRPTVL
jgi:hypothetical protein